MGKTANPAWVSQLQNQQLPNYYPQQLLGLSQYVSISSTSTNTYEGYRELLGQACWAWQPRAPDLQHDGDEKTAEALLLRHLNDEQKASWEKYKGFWVIAKSGNRYWLDGGRPRSMPQNGPPQAYCIMAFNAEGGYLPMADQILAQKLLIETDEEKFLSTANPSRL